MDDRGPDLVEVVFLLLLLNDAFVEAQPDDVMLEQSSFFLARNIVHTKFTDNIEWVDYTTASAKCQSSRKLTKKKKSHRMERKIFVFYFVPLSSHLETCSMGDPG